MASSSTTPVGEISLRQQMLSSSFGALATSVLVTPMDVVKIRLQRQVKPMLSSGSECFVYHNGLMDHLCVCGNPTPLNGQQRLQCEWFNRPGHFNGMLDAFVKITRHEGSQCVGRNPLSVEWSLTNYVCGGPFTLKPALWKVSKRFRLSAVPATIFYFTLYDNILGALRKRVGNKFYVPLMSGSIARAAAVTVVSPLELIRTKMQSQKHTYQELRHAIKATVASDGYSALWRGWAATMLREIPFSSTYWTCYELFKARLLETLGRSQTSLPISLLCGASAGSVAVVLTMPFDVVKTQQQITLGVVGVPTASPSAITQPQLPPTAKSLAAIMRDLVRSKGVKSLFTGLVPRLMRVGPSCAVMIGSFEYFKQLFQHRNERRTELL